MLLSWADQNMLNVLAWLKLCQQPRSEEVGEKLLEACIAGNLDTVFCHLNSGVDVNFRNEVRLYMKYPGSVSQVQYYMVMCMHSVLNSTAIHVAWRNCPHSGQCIWTCGRCGSAAEFSCSECWSGGCGNVMCELCDLTLKTFLYAISLWATCILFQEGNTALHTSSYYGNVDIVLMLLQAGADVNAVNKVWLYDKPKAFYESA